MVSLAGQMSILLLASPVADPTVEPSLWQRLVGVAVTAFAYAFVGFVVGLVTFLWANTRAGRVLGVGLFTSIFTLVFAANVISTVTRILSGTHMTVGAVEFLMSSPQHFIHAAHTEYAWSVRGVVAMIVAFAIATAARTVSTLRAPGAPRLRSMSAVVAVLGVTLVFGVGSAQAALDQRVFASTAELAFAHSVRTMSGLGDVVTAAGRDRAPLPEVGPPRSDDDCWNRMVEDSDGPRPNVLLLTLESVSYKHLGYEGYRRGVTPNLDALARGSVRFRRAWATATHSNYAQMAILSSLFPRRGNQLDMYHELPYPRLLPHDLFHKLGYRTATISSQDENWQGMRRFQDTGTPTYFWHSGDYDGIHIDTGSEHVVPDEATVSHVIKWIDKQAGKSWALYVNLQATHFPYKLPHGTKRPMRPDEPNPATFHYLRYPEAEREVVVNRYDNALAYVDRQVGRLRNHLKSLGQLERTLWVITSDHGEMFHQHGMVTHGKSLYDAESRVSILFHWPNVLAPRDLMHPVSHLDIMPTVAELLEVPPHPSYQGRNMLTSERDRTAIFMNIQGIRHADGIVCDPWKFIYDHTGSKAFLFHLKDDPNEQRNVVNEFPKVAGALAAVLQAQVDAQLAYHKGENSQFAKVFQPRLGMCPLLR